MHTSWLDLGLIVGSAIGFLVACGGDSESTSDAGPVGSVARNATEAWPSRPTGVPVLAREEIVSACARHVACADEPRETPAEGVGACVGQIAWSAERAIPLSGLEPAWERPEYFVRCVLDAADCTAVLECRHPRDERIYCEEDGCRVTTDVRFAVTCDGSVASLDDGTLTLERDCRAAFAECDPDSLTGCTDRPFTACPEDQTGDRCEGDIRLGCDSHGQVSYRDCARLGGTCGPAEEGVACSYGDGDSECTDGNFIFSYCDGESVIVCVTGKRMVVPAPELCAVSSP